MGRLRRLVSGCCPHHSNQESRTGSDVVITRISCPTGASATEMPSRTVTHSGDDALYFGRVTALLVVASDKADSDHV